MSEGSKTILTADELVEKLRAALQRDGDFPASAKVVNELRRLTTDPRTTANQITEVILKEPSLGTRVLHLVNSSFYRRAKPIMTVSQAVVQIGMRPLAELCQGLVLLQKFVPKARSGGPFAKCLQRMIMSSIMGSSLAADIHHKDKSTGKDEQGFLAGSFSEIGTLLLAYYFPKIYDTAVKRAETKNIEIGKSIQQITGLTPRQISIEVVDALDLPEFYKNVLSLAEKTAEHGKVPPGTGPTLPGASSKINARELCQSTFAAQAISEVLVSSNNKADLDKTLRGLAKQLDLEESILAETLGRLPDLFREQCGALELQLPALPEFVGSYTISADGEAQETQIVIEDRFNQFVQEIREAVENREPTASVITSVMETFAFSLDFDRVFLMLVEPGRASLVGRMLLGNVEGFDPRSTKRPLGDSADKYAPDNTAFQDSRPVFNGDPIFDDGWPMAAIPVGFGQRTIGIIYADKVGKDDEEISSREQAAIGMLAELLDRSIGLNSEL